MTFQVITEEVVKEWDAFVAQNNGSVFSTSTYLSSCSENWVILYSDNKTGGMACPYTIRAGEKILYTPFFLRYLEWIGEPISSDSLITTLKNEFQVCDLQLMQEIEPFVTGKFQFLPQGNAQLNQQAKRSLKKSANYTVIEKLNSDSLINLINNELGKKIKTINSNTLPILERLIQNFEGSGLIQLNLEEEGKWLGGLWLIEDKNTILYLKGTVSDEAKQKGGMYLLIQTAIELAQTRKKDFDFGGSTIENVRRFNLHFGAKDIVYSHIQWNYAPIWWKTLRFLKNKWNKK